MKTLGYDLEKFGEEAANTGGSIPKIQKILNATDLSENSIYAFRYAIKSGEQNSAELYILHVLEIPLFPSFLPGEEGSGILSPGYVEKLEKSKAKQKEMLTDKVYRRFSEVCRQDLQGNTNIILNISLIEIVEGTPP